LNDLPEEAFPHLQGLDLWILNTLRYTPHPSHLSMTKALHWIERMQPRRAVLTHLHVDIDYDELAAKLPPTVAPAFDGMTFEF
jgi:phosphoribosyl 1,2-cyclic phosphate phosphodiesterase